LFISDKHSSEDEKKKFYNVCPWHEADRGIEFILGFSPFDEPPFFTAAPDEDLFAPDFDPNPPPPLTTVTLTPLVDRVEPDEIFVPTNPLEDTTVVVFLTDDV
jgi:hypothetical protein